MALPELRVVHFNDVYECVGASRFARLLKRLAFEHTAGPTITLFSGDALNPSLMSTITKGKHMVPILNSLGVAASCLGNHDLDFGVPDFERIAEQHAFPWLCANVTEKASGRLLGGCKPYTVVAAGPWRVGLIGLVEEEWIATLATVDPTSVVYEDAGAVAGRLAPALREQEGCHLVLALTHMRVPNDERLAYGARGVQLDAILGGHDHDYVTQGLRAEAEGQGAGQQQQQRAAGGASVPIVKSGSDFRTCSVIRVSQSPLGPLGAVGPAGSQPVLQGCATTNSGLHLSVYRYDVSPTEGEDADMAATVEQFAGVLTRKLDQVVGVSRVQLDSRFEAIRTRETAAGNFMCDLMRQAVDADCCILNSGTLRADALIGPGLVRLRDLVALLPMQDSTVKLRMPGSRILQALENSVSAWPAKEGRFSQVSGVRFAFDPSRPPGQRVIRDSIRILTPARQDKGEASKSRAAEVASASASPPPGESSQSGLETKHLDATIGGLHLHLASSAREETHHSSLAISRSDSGSGASPVEDVIRGSGIRTPFDVERVAIEEAATPVPVSTQATGRLTIGDVEAGGSSEAQKPHGSVAPGTLDVTDSTNDSAAAALVSPHRRLQSLLPHGYATHIHGDSQTWDAGLSNDRPSASRLAEQGTLESSPGGAGCSTSSSDGGIGFCIDVPFSTAVAVAASASAAAAKAIGLSVSVSAGESSPVNEGLQQSPSCVFSVDPSSTQCLSPGQSAIDSGLRIASLLPPPELSSSDGATGFDRHYHGTSSSTEGRDVAGLYRVATTLGDLSLGQGAATPGSSILPLPLLRAESAPSELRGVAKTLDGTFVKAEEPPAGSASSVATPTPSSAASTDLGLPLSSPSLTAASDTASSTSDPASVRSSASASSAASSSLSSQVSIRGVSSPAEAETMPSCHLDGASPSNGDGRARGHPGLHSPSLLPNPTLFEVTSSGQVRRKEAPLGVASAVNPSSDGTVSQYTPPASSHLGASGRSMWAPLDERALYTVATKSYLSHGKDGFTCFAAPDVEILIGEENGPILPTIVRNHFRILAALSGFSKLDVAHATSPAQSRLLRPKAEGLRRVPTHAALHGAPLDGLAHDLQSSTAGSEDVHGAAPHAGSPPGSRFTFADGHAVTRAPGRAPRGAHGLAHALPRYSLAIAPLVDGRIRQLSA